MEVYLNRIGRSGTKTAFFINKNPGPSDYNLDRS